MASAGGEFTWVDRFHNTECNTEEGEKYLGASSKRVSNIEACKQSCEDAAACRSITFLTDGRCSHFSTECKERKFTASAIAIQLKRNSTEDTNTMLPATTSTSAITTANTATTTTGTIVRTSTTALIGKGTEGTTTAPPGRFINVLH